MKTDSRMLYYFVLWCLGRLEEGMDDVLTTIDARWKENVLQSEGVFRHRANQWKRRVRKTNVLKQSYLFLLEDLEYLFKETRNANVVGAS